MSASSNRQTMAKMTRERALKERRALKQEKKDGKKRAAEAELRGDNESGLEYESGDGESSLSAPAVDSTADE